MASPIRSNVLVLDSDKNFQEALKYAMQVDTIRNDESTAVLIQIDQPIQIVEINLDMNWSHLIIDVSFVNVETNFYLNQILCKNPKCKIVLLIPSQDNLNIKDTLRIIDSWGVKEEIEFILSDNISESEKVMQCYSLINCC
jgi:hypothetical protein